jgi:hypothetical protein
MSDQYLAASRIGVSRMVVLEYVKDLVCGDVSLLHAEQRVL